LGIAFAIKDLCIQNTECLVAEACEMSHLLSNRIKQSYQSKRWQSIVLQLWHHSSYLLCVIAWLIVMLVWAIFRMCWGFSKCVETHICDHMSLGMDWYYTFMLEHPLHKFWHINKAYAKGDAWIKIQQSKYKMHCKWKMIKAALDDN